MREVEELEARIMNLPREDLAKLRQWFLELDNEIWDEQIAADLKAGKLKGIIDASRAELAQGRAGKL